MIPDLSAEWLSGIEFERLGWLARVFKRALVDPMANYLPAGLVKAVLRFSKSELAAASWVNPGGWRSMVISYDGRPKQIADKILVGTGTMSKALRNRRRLGSHVLAHLIDHCPAEPVHVLCLGAGPGRIILDAMKQARREAHATLVDLNPDSFDYGRELARQSGLGDRVRFIQGDIRDGMSGMLDRPPDIVKMLGICEYLSDEQITSITEAVARSMPAGASIVFNSISKAHGNDRFFRRVFGLHMVHRTPRQLQDLFAAAGFSEFHAMREPLGVYHVIAGRKTAPKP